MSKGEMTLTLGLLAISLGILAIGTTLPKKNVEGLTLCNSTNVNDVGYLQGIVTEVKKDRGKLYVSITEGTAGCPSLLLADTSQWINLQPGNRIKFKAKVTGNGMFQLIGKAEIDPTVVDTEGNTEKPELIKVLISNQPEFYSGNKYALVSVRKKDSILRLKIDEATARNIKLNERADIYYYPSTKMISSVEYP